MPKLICVNEADKKEVGSLEYEANDSTAELFIFGDIVSESWQSEYYEDDKCPKDIKDFLDEIGDVESLDIHINSGGGSVFGGIAIYNLLKQKKCKKIVYIDGIAASIASVIACVGDEIHVPENATFMIHKPSNGYFLASMNADELRKDADTLDSCQKAILRTYMSKAKAGVSEDVIDDLINQETWLIGSEVLDYFEFEIDAASDAVACSSDLFKNYKKLPDTFKSSKNVGKNVDKVNKGAPNVSDANVDTSAIVDEVLKKLDERYVENKKNELLNDLDCYGE